VLLAAVDWTQVILAAIGAVVAVVNGLGIALVLARIRTPSGDRIGAIAERTEHLASASVTHTTHLVEALNGTSEDTTPHG
jgi:hypothetical protein